MEWDEDAALTYALGLGIGLHDAETDLEFVTENSRDLPQRTVLTFGAMLATSAGHDVEFGGCDRALLVHAGQEFALHRDPGVRGAANVRTSILGVHDVGAHALVRLGIAMRDAVSDEPIVTAETSVLLRGVGGFGWPRPEIPRWSPPGRTPDVTVSIPTLPGQALLYRMSGDRNPLHSDPRVAREAGFGSPILHGMCSYGIAGHHLEKTILGGDRSSFHAILSAGRLSLDPGRRDEGDPR